MKTQKQQGFTIIEVVLVLAIAGLIFLVVFLAVPALQRSQRDTQRRQDVGRVVSAVQSFRTNNSGNIPAAAADWNGANFKGAYLTVGSETFGDPQTGDYTLTESTNLTGTTIPQATIWVHRGAVCNGAVATTSGAGSRNVAFRILLESGGTYCASN